MVLLTIIDGLQFFQLNYFIIFLGAAAGLAKILYWCSIDSTQSQSNTSTATGLGSSNKSVSMLDAPTTSETFIMREMGFKIVRKHSRRLRLITILTLSVIPIMMIFLMTQPVAFVSPMALGIIAILFSSFGTIIERWLFFAEAKHVAMLYYGANKA
jgi:hypothetical protein